MNKTLSLILIFLLTSCTDIILISYGVSLPNEKDNNNNTILKYSKKYSIPEQYSFYIDSTYFDDIINLKEHNYELFNDLMQPLQIRFFNKEEELISYYANCHVGGYPNLNWNAHGLWDTYPPKYYIEIDTQWSLSNEAIYYNSFDKNNFNLDQFNEADLIISVYWTIFMKRQSKRLISLMQNYQQNNSDKNIIILYFNFDKVYNYLYNTTNH